VAASGPAADEDAAIPDHDAAGDSHGMHAHDVQSTVSRPHAAILQRGTA
jgi:hypothetical protein